MTVKELIALGFGGYQEWDDVAANANFKETGGAGKFTGGKSLDPFIKKWRGLTADYDGAWGGQCVDLIRFYLRDVLGIPAYSLPAVLWANQLYTNFTNTKDFIQIPNAAYNYPIKGDIIVYKPYWYPYKKGGHVSIVVDANSKTVTQFEQNFPSGSKCTVNTRGYGLLGKAVYGWLRPVIKIV